MTTPRSELTPLAFIYDRNATRSTTVLDQRLTGCQNYAKLRGWEIAGQWLDLGDNALSDHRPELARLIDAMQARARDREVICLVHTWGRLTHDADSRIRYQMRIAQAGGHTETAFAESDARSVKAMASKGGQQQ